MSKRFITLFALLLALSALPVSAQTEGTTNTGVFPPPDAPPTPTNQPAGMLPAKPAEMPSFQPSTLPPKPSFYQNAIQRAEEAKQNIEERGELIKQQFGIPPGMAPEGFLEEKPELRDRIREHASTTMGNIVERRQEFRQEFLERASTTRANIVERREDLREKFLEHASTTRGAIMERREFIQEQFEERKARFGSTTEQWKAEFTEEMKARISEHADHAANLLGAMLTRLEGIADRIAERIAALDAEGVDVSLAETALQDADEKIADAETAIAEVKAAMAEALESETPRDSLGAVKPLLEAAKAALRAAHEALRAAALALPKPPGGTLPEGEPEEPVTP